MSTPELSIIIPAYREAHRIERTLAELEHYLRRHHLEDSEVIVVAADSPDGTAELARKQTGRFRDLRIVEPGPRVGKGRDVRAGMLAARGEYRLFMDADLATPLHYIQDVLHHAEQQAEVIIAVRDLTSSHTGWRKWLSGSGNILVRTLLLPGIGDSQCGFKAFSAMATEELFRRQTILGWGFDMEILVIAKNRHYRITQIPVPDWSDQPDGTFEAGWRSMIQTAMETLWELIVIRWRLSTGGYRHKQPAKSEYDS